MIITLNQNEIQQAIADKLEQQGFNLEGKEVKSTFTTGRKGKGITAEIRIFSGDPELDDETEDTEEIEETKTIEKVEEGAEKEVEQTTTSSIFA